MALFKSPSAIYPRSIWTRFQASSKTTSQTTSATSQSHARTSPSTWSRLKRQELTRAPNYSKRFKISSIPMLTKTTPSTNSLGQTPTSSSSVRFKSVSSGPDQYSVRLTASTSGLTHTPSVLSLLIAKYTQFLRRTSSKLLIKPSRARNSKSTQ